MTMVKKVKFSFGSGTVMFSAVNETDDNSEEGF